MSEELNKSISKQTKCICIILLTVKTSVYDLSFFAYSRIHNLMVD